MEVVWLKPVVSSGLAASVGEQHPITHIQLKNGMLNIEKARSNAAQG